MNTKIPTMCNHQKISFKSITISFEYPLNNGSIKELIGKIPAFIKWENPPGIFCKCKSEAFINKNNDIKTTSKYRI